MTGERAIEFASVDWEAGAPRSIFFDDIYFSGAGAAETRHVFLDGNALEARFPGAARFTIGELGFGSGLNFLSAADLWRRLRRPGATLHFLSVEKFPLCAEDLRRAGAAWPQFADGVEALARAYPPPVAGLHHLRFEDGVTLTLGLGDAALLFSRCEACVDAWFLDGFSPAKNPEMWSDAIFREVARLSAPGATAATFTVAGAVRRGLEAAGFKTEKRAGYGRKREMLTAAIDAPPRGSKRAPWFPAAKTALAPGARVAVIGGGVAGASLADAAAAAGLQATIIDPAGLASGASGNPAGLIMPRLDLGDGAASRFFIAAYLHALATLARLERETGAALFNACGVAQPSLSESDRQWAEKVLAARLAPPTLVTRRDDGLFFPRAGVVDPVAYVAALARGAELIKASAVSIDAGAEGVRVRLASADAVEAGAAVIANGADALRLAQARTLPLARIAGQVDWFKDAPALEIAHAFGPYAAPAPGGGAVIGATYDKIADGQEPQTSVAATRSTIEAVAAALPGLARSLSALRSAPRASIRCQTPDRLPVAGPAPDFHFYGAAYDRLRTGGARDYPDGAVVPNVYFLTGLGSRGLVTAPLCAAMIVAEMTGAPAPVAHDIAEALHPARFFIRDLKRAVKRRAILRDAAEGGRSSG
jgi:tRNA 5-methylaminomethyl-2-thiouridine biosynthesis bifunctional protein